MKLIKLSDYVSKLQNGDATSEISKRINTNVLSEIGDEKWGMVVEYKELLQQKPELGDFIPCKDGKPIEIEDCSCLAANNRSHICPASCYKEYQAVLDRVKFKGFSRRVYDTPKDITIVATNGLKTVLWFHKGECSSYNKPINTLEDLTEYELELTQNKEEDEEWKFIEEYIELHYEEHDEAIKSFVKNAMIDSFKFAQTNQPESDVSFTNHSDGLRCDEMNQPVKDEVIGELSYDSKNQTLKLEVEPVKDEVREAAEILERMRNRFLLWKGNTDDSGTKYIIEEVLQVIHQEVKALNESRDSI